MGIFWFSKAEVVSQEPEIIKNLIEEIAEDEDYTSVYDLEIKGNSIFFNSGGYGYYGTYFEDEASLQLFEKLFERYDGALVAFEHVHPCQCQGYHFNSQWIKPEGEVDWDDEKTYWLFRRMVTKKTELDEGDFDIADCWHICLDMLDNRKDLPMLYALVQKAKAEGFDEWGNGEIGFIEQENFISYGILNNLIDKYWNEKADEDKIFLLFDDVERDMTRWVTADDIYYFEHEFKMPDDFPELQTSP
jgi:hypothetical protein